jgi:hypothetical protein
MQSYSVRGPRKIPALRREVILPLILQNGSDTLTIDRYAVPLHARSLLL